MNMADLIDTFASEVRAIQSLYPQAHQALKNWAAWSRDCAPPSGIGIKPCAIWEPYRPGDDYGDEDTPQAVVEAPVRAEAADKDPYDQLAAEVLNDRLHGPGGLPRSQYDILKVVYVTRCVPEEQMPKLCGCLPDHFKERLSAVLHFTQRFV